VSILRELYHQRAETLKKEKFVMIREDFTPDVRRKQGVARPMCDQAF
jgi:hypothetical protein